MNRRRLASLFLSALIVVFVAACAGSGRDPIVGTWKAVPTGYQVRVTRTGAHAFAGVAVTAYKIGPCTSKPGRVVWKHLTLVGRGRYRGTFAEFAFTSQDPSTCDPNFSAPLTATIGTQSGLSMKVCYLPGGCRTWTRN